MERQIEEMCQTAPQVVSFVIGTLGSISMNLSASKDNLKISDISKSVRVAGLLGTAEENMCL